MVIRYQDFISDLNSHGGVIASNRFEVVIHPSPIMGKVSISSPGGSAIPNPFETHGVKGLISNLEHFKFMCVQTSLPGISVATNEPRHYGPVVKVPYSKIFEDISMTFLCTSKNYVERRFFDAWIESVCNYSNHDFNYLNEYVGTAEIYALNYKLERVYGLKLINFFPLSISNVDLSHDNSEPQRLEVLFSYDHHRTIGTV